MGVRKFKQPEKVKNMAAKLSLKDFLIKYNALVMQGVNNDPIFVKELIQEHFQQISKDCWNYLKARKQLKVGEYAWEIEWQGQHPRDIALKVEALTNTSIKVNGLWDKRSNWVAV